MDEKSRENIWKYSLILLIFALGILLFRQAKPFISGALGALTLYILLRQPTNRLAERINATAATTLVVLAVVVFFIVPLSLIIWFIIAKLQQVNWDPNVIIAPAKQAIDIMKDKVDIDLFSDKVIPFAVTKLTAIGQSILNGVGDFFINIFVAILLLFFLLQGGKRMENWFESMMPLKKVNKKEVLDRIGLMVRSNAIGIPLLALIQGILAWGGYFAFGVPNPILCGILTGLCSVVPVVGTMIVWIPLVGYFAVLGLWGKAIGLFFFCAIVISQSDNLIRFILQKKMANTHPLITIFGVIAGIPLFGFIGIIFGPLLVSLFLLFLDMFRKEYLMDYPET